MAYQRFDGTMSFLPSRFEAQAMLSEMQKKKDEEMKLLRLKQAEEQKQQTEAVRSELNRMLAELRAMTANREATMSQFVSQTSIPPRPPFPPPEPPDIRKSEQNLATKAIDPPNFTKSDLISVVKAAPGKTKVSTRKLLRKYSCEEVYERMETGLCVFCEEQDTPGHYNLKHKRSPIVIIESEDEQLSDDNNLVEPALEEIVDEPIEKTLIIFPNPEKESRPEVSVTPFQVPLSSMEPSRRCRNDSLDAVDERMCNELVCDEDGDSVITISTKFSETYEDPQFELVSLEQSHDPVENHLDNIKSALTRSSLSHMPTHQYRAPFNHYQNRNNQCHYKRDFGNFTGHEIEFDRECEEIEDDELKDKQPEEDVETLVMSENTQSLECVDDEFYVDENLIKVIAEETAIELVDESGHKVFKERNLNSLLFQEFQIVLLHLKESSDTIVPCRNLDTRVSSSHFFAGGIMLLSKMVCAFLLPLLTMNIDSRTICLDSRSIFVDDDAAALRRIVEDRFVLRMEEIYLESIEQNLEFAIDRGWVEFWTNTHDSSLTNYGLRLSPSEYTKNTFILVYLDCKHSSSCLFLNTRTGCIGALLMLYDAKRLIQLDAPPVFSDLLCVMNRIRVRLKMILLLKFLWLILFTSKMFKSANVHQNKNQTDQKLSSHWKFLLRLLHPLHINRWRSFYLLVIKTLFKGKEESVSFNVAVTSCSSYVKVLELIKDKASRKGKLCKNWWFKYKLNTWLSEALHFWMKRKYEKLQRASEDMMSELIYKIRKACHCVVHETNQTAYHVWYGWIAKAEIISIPIMHLKGKEETFSFNIAVKSCGMFCFFPYSTWMVSQNRHASSSCALRKEENHVLVLFIIIEALTLFNDQHTLVAEKNETETSIVLKQIFGRATHQLLLKQSLSQVLLHIQNRDCSFFGYMLVTTSDGFGTLLEIPDKEIAKPHRIFFLRVLIEWKWYPPTQAIRSFTKLSMTSNQILYP